VRAKKVVPFHFSPRYRDKDEGALRAEVAAWHEACPTACSQS